MAGFDWDRWWYEIQSTIPSEALTASERDQLRTMVTSRTFKKAITMVYAECVGAGTSMLKLDLTTQEGISQGLLLQGKAQGMTAVLESLIDLTQDPDEEPEDEGDKE